MACDVTRACRLDQGRMAYTLSTNGYSGDNIAESSEEVKRDIGGSAARHQRVGKQGSQGAALTSKRKRG